jgi:hypothetical protein
VVPTSLDFKWRKKNFRSHSKFNRLNSFQDFGIGRIATFPLDSIMCEGMELTFNKSTKPSMYLDVHRFTFLGSISQVMITLLSTIQGCTSVILGFIQPP